MFVFGGRVFCNVCTILGRTFNHTNDAAMTNCLSGVVTRTEQLQSVSMTTVVPLLQEGDFCTTSRRAVLRTDGWQEAVLSTLLHCVVRRVTLARCLTVRPRALPTAVMGREAMRQWWR
jgi:hypothetical protein